MSEDSEDLYPDEYFVGFDGAKLAGDGYLAIARHRNPDGIIFDTVDYYGSPQRAILGLDGWQELTLRIWAEHLEARAVFDRLEDDYGPWIADLPCDGLFDWMGWRPWEMMRAWQLPPDPFLQQVPRTFGLRRPTGPDDPWRWTLPDYHFSGNEAGRRGIDLSKWARMPMDNRTFRQLLADSVVEMPAKTWQPEPTHLEIAGYEPDQGEELPPDTNHGGDRHPGRYA